LAAALTSSNSFQGKSALRTWLIGILNHKIQDAFRRESRYVHPQRNAEFDAEGGSASTEDFLLDQIGGNEGSDSLDPLLQVSRRELGDGLSREIEALPATLREVFVMQVLEGLSTEEVCERLQISEANCWVRLHRARKRLSERLRDHLE